MLLVHPVEKNEKQLPSPYQLRRKIILKHKKLPDGQEECSVLIKNDGNDMDLRNSVKNGIMYLEDPVDKEWNPHFFALTQSKLFYTDSYKSEQVIVNTALSVLHHTELLSVSRNLKDQKMKKTA